MVGAADDAAHVAVGFGQLRPPVAARVDEPSQPAVAVPGDQHRCGPDPADQHPARFGHFGSDAHRHPGPPEQPLLLQREEAGVAIGVRVESERLGQRPPGGAPGRVLAPVRRTAA